MDMEIQQVPWWNRRSRMERSFFVLAVALLCLAVAMGVALAAVLYRAYGASSSSTEDASSAGAFVGPPGAISNGHGGGMSEAKSSDKFCMTKGCVQTAADILNNIDESVDPCEDFYHFACGGFMERVSIPDDRTRMSSFSVLGDELLTQVRKKTPFHA